MESGSLCPLMGAQAVVGGVRDLRGPGDDLVGQFEYRMGRVGVDDSVNSTKDRSARSYY